jgi:phage terminase large subunit-like protein
MSTLKETIKAIARNFDHFTERGGGIKMRPYQLEPAQAIYDSITQHAGRTIVIIISRQAGKDELLANLVTYLLRMFSHREAGIVYVNPTYKPQTINAMMRLENRLKTNLLTRATWKKRADFMRMIDTCTVSSNRTASAGYSNTRAPTFGRPSPNMAHSSIVKSKNWGESIPW